ncbi:MAG TPA: DNA polymerase III subunit gamma/tau [Ktedonobacterales bacterium]|nr:DNA polymerase III subunit gamma/tau [Ktedonobacterales bacterium]
MASQSLYRKWRSQTFADLVGQEEVVRTLLNAVRDGRLAHAYLFCGPRGTGKTSVARLLAKAINCQNPHNGEPCNECISCQEITSGRSPDVIEIDAASNTGVDNIRDLRENVNLLGSGGHHKVYVVDECHMLSTAAFNALLKTLEEPPPHVIFVLATTEAHKVLPTIISRCQRFDFRRHRMRDIVSHLHHVADGEGLTLEPAAAEMIARAAQGGMRDALSLLDQAITFCGTEIDAKSVRGMLGLADPATLRALIEAVADQNTADGLERIHTLVSSGADPRQLSAQYAEEWRALMLARAGADVVTIMDRTAEEAQATVDLSRRFSLEELAACARVFARNEQPARGLPVPQLALELAFLECVGVCAHGGLANDYAPAESQSRPATSARAQRTPRPESQPESPPMPTVAANQPAPVADLSPRDDGDAEDMMAMPADDAPPETGTLEAGAVAAPMPTPMPVPPEPPQMGAEQDAALVNMLRDIQRRWTMIKKVCKQKSSMVSGLLSDAQPVRLDAGSPLSLTVAVKWPFHLEKLREPSKREAVEWALEQVLEQAVRVRLVLASDGGSGQPATNPPQRPSSSPAAPGKPDTLTPNNIVPFPTAQAAGSSRPTETTRTKGAAARPPMTSPSPPADAATSAGKHLPDVAALEREVRADPVIQELIRIGGTELAEVRPLDDGDGT